jgi:hypothetical protein
VSSSVCVLTTNLLPSLSTLQDVLKKLSMCEVIAFEKSSGIGGVWNMQQNTKKGRAQNPMYSTLKTNLPKEIMAINADTPMTHNSHARGTSFVGHVDVQQYLQDFADNRNLHEHVRYNTEVVSVSKDREKTRQQWTLRSRESSSPTGAEAKEEEREEKEENFDHIIVCNGHYTARNFPTPSEMESTGMAAFAAHKGTVVLHSGDFDGPDPAIYAGKSVLVVGGRNSATDIAREISAVAKVVHCSDRNAPSNPCTAPGTAAATGGADGVFFGGNDEHRNLKHYSGIKTYDAENHIVHFFGGQSASEVDVLIWCTGFMYDFNFLAKPWDTVSESGRRVEGLYEQLFNIDDPSLAYIGLPFSVVPFPLFYVQARVIADAVSGSLKLPNYSNRKQWLQNKEAELKAKNSLTDSKYHYLGNGHEQWEYSARLISLRSKDALSINEKKEAEVENILNHLQVCKEIYAENRSHMPSKVGYSDSYRSINYSIVGDGHRWEMSS